MGEIKDTLLTASEIHELEIPVPWGHIAAKTWNDPCGWPVLAVHGLQDNAGTFDRLIPLLPASFYFVAIDLPGHGRSSHFPPGLPLNFMDYVTSLKRIFDHMKWAKFIYMGHSLGGQIGAVFTSLFPELVSRLIMLDAIATPILPKHSLLKRHRMLFDNLQDLERKVSIKSPPKYTYEEALNRMVDNRNSKLTQEAAEALIKRSLVATADGYRFTTDQRLKPGLRPFMYLPQHLEVVEKIRCPHLIILAQETLGYVESGLKDFKTIIETYQASPKFMLTVVEGNHDVHNNHPERLVSALTQFLYLLKSSI